MAIQIFLLIVGATLLFLTIVGQIRRSIQFAVKDPFNPAHWEKETFYTLLISALFYMAAGAWQ